MQLFALDFQMNVDTRLELITVPASLDQTVEALLFWHCSRAEQVRPLLMSQNIFPCLQVFVYHFLFLIKQYFHVQYMGMVQSALIPKSSCINQGGILSPTPNRRPPICVLFLAMKTEE